MSTDEDSDGELRLAATILNECETEGQREEYVKALQKHASVHIYGRCGAPCPGWVTEDCLRYLDQHYKVRLIDVIRTNLDWQCFQLVRILVKFFQRIVNFSNSSLVII